MNRSQLLLATTLSISTAIVACGDDEEEPVTPITTTTPTTTTAMGGGGTGGTTTTTAMGGGGAGGAACSNIDVATEAGLTSLVAAVDQAGLTATIDGLENGTIFAPSNEAFDAILTALEAAGLSGDLTEYTPEQLVPLLTYHVAGSVIDSGAAVATAAGAGEFDTLGGTVTISGDATDGLVLDENSAFSANINLQAVDVPACNGTIVHVIDAVIAPSIAEVVTTQDDYQDLEDLIVASDGTEAIVATLDGYATATPALDYTLFAPTNMAVTDGVDFLTNNGGVPDAAGLTPILQFHVALGFTPASVALALPANSSVTTALTGSNLTVSGGSGVTIDEGLEADANVTIVDIPTANGIIHRVDQILVPPAP